MNPNSGSAPYTFTISFKNKELISTNYTFEVLLAGNTTACPTMGAGTVNAVVTSALLENDVYIRTEEIVNLCQAYTARIKNSDGVVISSQYVNVDNIP